MCADSTTYKAASQNKSKLTGQRSHGVSLEERAGVSELNLGCPLLVSLITTAGTKDIPKANCRPGLAGPNDESESRIYFKRKGELERAHIRFKCLLAPSDTHTQGPGSMGPPFTEHSPGGGPEPAPRQQARLSTAGEEQLPLQGKRGRAGMD